MERVLEGESVVGTVSDSTSETSDLAPLQPDSASAELGLSAGLSELRDLQTADDSDPGTGWAAVGSLHGGRQILQSTVVPGLTVIRRYLNDEHHHALLDCADAVLYSATHGLAGAAAESTAPNQAVFLGSDGFPPLVSTVATEVARDLAGLEHTSAVWRRGPPAFNHLLINEYYPGDGILEHVDIPHRFADGIVGLSLASAIVFRLSPVAESDFPGTRVTAEVLLLPGDLYALEGDARWKWAHRIDPVDREEWQGVLIDRGRR